MTKELSFIHWTTEGKQMRQTLQLPQFTAWRQFPGWSSGTGSPDRTGSLAELRRKNSESRDVRVVGISRVKYWGGGSFTERERRAPEICRGVPWRLRMRTNLCVCVKGNSLRSGKEQPERSRQNSPWRSHRAGNDLCCHLLGWKDLRTQAVLSRDFRGGSFSNGTTLALDLPQIKASLGRIKLLLRTKPNNIQRNTIESSNRKHKIYAAQHPVKNYQECKEAGNMTYH